MWFRLTTEKRTWNRSLSRTMITSALSSLLISPPQVKIYFEMVEGIGRIAFSVVSVPY